MGGLRRLRLHLTDSEFSEYILSGRYRARIIKWALLHTSTINSSDLNGTNSVWRSFNGAADDAPLAFCNPSTITEKDPISIDIVESKRLAQNYYLRYNEEHQWFWAGDMSPSEVMVFTTWDSRKTGRAIDCKNPSNILWSWHNMITNWILLRCIPYRFPQPSIRHATTKESRNKNHCHQLLRIVQEIQNTIALLLLANQSYDRHDSLYQTQCNRDTPNNYNC